MGFNSANEDRSSTGVLNKREEGVMQTDGFITKKLTLIQ
jgi:hypothetical protein